MREAITHDETGRLVDFFDGGGLVEEIDQLLEDPEMRTRLGRAARAHIRETYDLRTICLPQQMEWVEGLGRMIP